MNRPLLPPTIAWLVVSAVVVVVVGGACPASTDDEAGGGGGEVGEGEGEGEGEAGDGGVDDGCAFNADCQASLRCGCADGACLCESGVRGAGRSGVDSCVDGNDCDTALCVEGQPDSGGATFFCSGPCDVDDDCGAALPTCADIACVGRICIRRS